jgi:molybdopterin molybdotransferase
MAVFEAQWHEAQTIASALGVPTDAMTLPLSQALGHVTATDVVSLSDLPPFAASRIDGWAVSGAGPWKVVGAGVAGSRSAQLNAGECAHIATGAWLPEGATACLKDEESHLSDGVVSATNGAAQLLTEGRLPEGHDVRPQGLEARRGEIVVPAGSLLQPGVLGMVAAAGYDTVEVRRPVTFDVVLFGDELITEGPSRDGMVRDSLGPQLPGWISLLGGTVISVRHVPDTFEDHRDALASCTADIVVTTGSTAAGPVDHLHAAIAAVGGALEIDAVLIRPGYHSLLAQLPNRILVGLPGNPQSAVVGLLSLIEPLVRAMQGRPPRLKQTRVLATSANAPSREIRFALCSETADGVSPVTHVDSSMLRGFVDAAGYALIAPGGQEAGAVVEWLPLPMSVG